MTQVRAQAPAQASRPTQQASAKRKTISRTKAEWLTLATKLGKSVRAGNLRLEDADAQLDECPDSRLKLDCMHCVRAELAGNKKKSAGAQLSFGKPQQLDFSSKPRQRAKTEQLTTANGLFSISVHAAASFDASDLTSDISDPVTRSQAVAMIQAFKARPKLSFPSRR